MKTKTNNDQLAFDFTPVRPDFLATPQVPALAGMTPLGIPAAAIIGPATNATFETSPGSFHRVILHGEVREGHRHYRRIQFPGATYSDGAARIQTVHAGVVTPDPF